MTEEFRDIPGFPGLQATSYGRIIGRLGNEIGTPTPKYVVVSSRPGVRVKGHPRKQSTQSRGRLILLAFVGPPPPDKPEVDHIDQNKHNDRPENLRWTDRYEQMQNRGVKADSGTGVKGLYLHKATEPNHSDRWRCTINHLHESHVKYFRLDQREEAIAWLEQKRIELNL